GLVAASVALGAGAGAGVVASLPDKTIAAAPPPRTSSATMPSQSPPPFFFGVSPLDSATASLARGSAMTVTGALKSGAANAEPNEPVPTLAMELGLESLPIRNAAASSCLDAAFFGA